MSQFCEPQDNNKRESLIPSNQWGDSVSIDADKVRENLLDITNKIAHCKSRIIAVTKYYGLEAIKIGYEVGLRDFGESRANEAIQKIQQLNDEMKNNSTFHFIGHLQTNKAEKVVEYFDYIHSVDSLKLAKEISKAAFKFNKAEKIFLQVNNADEKQKFGFSKKELSDNFKEIISLSNLEVVGLMNIAPINLSENELDFLFKDIRNFRDELEKKFNVSLPELSMGMSNDYVTALNNGATMIRLGRKLFT